MILNAVAMAIQVAVERLGIKLDYALGDFIKFFNVSEEFTTLDSAVLAFLKSKSDEVLLIDSLSRGFTKGIGENCNVSDQFVYYVVKQAAEIAHVSDTVSVMPFKALFDQIVVTDDFNGEASILDDQVMQFVKKLSELTGVIDTINFVASFIRSVTDSATVTETKVLNLVKSFSEQGTVSDSGMLRSQSYTADLSYFAEDYVGSVINF